jgi:hypothetical protein
MSRRLRKVLLDYRKGFASRIRDGQPEGLGHGNASIPARYYAAWIESEGYRNPAQVAEGRAAL